VPPRTVTNFDLERLVTTTDEWIRTRTGIRERRIASEETATSDLATAAARKALEAARTPPGDIDLVLVGTMTPDMVIPATACLVQDAVGARRAAGFDLSIACSAFIYGLKVAEGLIQNGTHRKILLIGAEVMSRIIDWQDPATCVLFGDGAGAAVIGPSADDSGILSSFWRCDGSLGHLLTVPAGGSRLPVSHHVIDQRQQYVKMAGSEVYKNAVREMGDAGEEALKRAGLSSRDVTLVIPHQANIRIIEATAKRLHVPMSKVFVNIDRFGNTVGASIPIALAEASERGLIRTGDIILLVAFGAGFAWGSAVVRW
jgi:3-oxoacyl-[acyl-carrier-protein] synthase-3